MKTKTLLLSLTLLLATLPAYTAPGPPVRARISKPSVSVSSRAATQIGRSVRVPSRSIGTSSSLPRFGTHSGTSSIAPQAAAGLGSVLNALGGFGGPGAYGHGSPWGYYDRHNPYEEMADAYRDAAIANAIVNTIGILVSASQTNRAPEPAGHYVTQRRLIKEGHYETSTVWVPETYDEANGVWIEGHHETQRRWVPEVWEKTRVWVPDAVVVRQ